jgi:hypothetical protein
MYAYQKDKQAKRGYIQTQQTFLGIKGDAKGRVLDKTRTSTLRWKLYGGRAIYLPIVHGVHVLHFGHNFPECILQSLKHKQHSMLDSTLHGDIHVYKLVTAPSFRRHSAPNLTQSHKPCSSETPAATHNTPCQNPDVPNPDPLCFAS